MPSLASELFREVDPAFFRVLAGANAPVYVDVLDLLERESSQRYEGISREDAIALVEDVLTRNPSFTLDVSEAPSVTGQSDAPPPRRELARRVLDHLARPETGWKSDEQLPNWAPVIPMDYPGAILIEALRKIAATHPVG